MPKPRYAARVDNNQNEIVADLRKLGFTVATDHDDILVGRAGKTYWYELKSDAKRTTTSKLQKTQRKLKDEWRGHYRIVSTLEEILQDMGEA